MRDPLAGAMRVARASFAFACAFVLWLVPVVALAQGAAAERATSVEREPERGPRRGLLYEAIRDDRRIVLFGTVHVTPPGSFPLDGVTAEAIGASDAFVIEVDLSNATAMQAAFAKHAVYPAGRSMRDALTPTQRERLTTWLRARGIDEEGAWRLKPGLLGVHLSVIEAARLGYTAAVSADMAALAIARAASKPVVELEGADAQFALLGGEGDEAAIASLIDTLDAIERGEAAEEIRGLVDAWFGADEAGLADRRARLRTSARATERRVYERLFAARDTTMARRLQGLSTQYPSLFVAVGALHLVGDGSVLDRLREAGWRVQRR